ncbi:JmjC domain-containing protein [Shewanella sp. 10N.286.48.B5]|uniref:JmjC domain-containing protein n=1 Tax=Shewanella sp. 10N.286.48.B5 TaxID=1880834 RepID=UPI000C8514BB|nr:cupin domain-containing protein [Shewanella sp. 10N.286.48.B5]PMH88755.1 hypothetical protein BCU57_03625 [Shewanella sp. 10N.286.48.B5]
MFSLKVGNESKLLGLTLPCWNLHDTEIFYKDICWAFQSASFDKNDIKVVVLGNPIPEEVIVNKIGEINNIRIIDLYSRGATLVLHGAERFSPVLKKSLSDSFSKNSESYHANIYLTPTNSPGVGYHFDDHDVIIFQISGSKLWYYKDKNSSELKFHTQRGHWYFLGSNIEHTTETINQFSMHLTIGLSSKKEVNLITRSVKKKNTLTIIESLNSINSELDKINFESKDINRSIDNYIRDLSLVGESNYLFDFIKSSTPENILKLITSDDFPLSSRLNFLKLLVKAQIVSINQG